MVIETGSIQERIRAVEAADSALALVQAVRSLAMAKDPAAIPTLITVLGFNNPGAAVMAVDGLVGLGAAAVPALLEQIDGYNYGARAWAIRALALIGDLRALEILVDTARGDFALSVRRAAAKGLGALRWQDMASGEIAPAQASVQAALLMASADPEWVVRYAAVVGLAGLATALGANIPESDNGGTLVTCAASTLAVANPEASITTCLEALQQRAIADEEILVRARAQRAIDLLTVG
ncbi:HEAT repeat domain-containing protein [Leptolyngbya sp. PCC 6406]|uniref:HEAT repeat domain-containing protein n=1 Tax=Leptolyngbya sp. PCC 6406 TaxID=1173264 RepID=UPI0002ABC576|nr:HEAT repeat domain-containing protein [Leptolyngbya sp. PCC 6406]